jgi:hypothetical protein
MVGCSTTMTIADLQKLRQQLTGKSIWNRIYKIRQCNRSQPKYMKALQTILQKIMFLLGRIYEMEFG